MEHTISRECQAIIKNLTEKINSVEARFDSTIDSFNEHMKESIDYRLKVVKLAETVISIEKSFLSIRNWVLTNIAVVLMSVGSFLFAWGSINKQVEINTSQISDQYRIIESMHPRNFNVDTR